MNDLYNIFSIFVTSGLLLACGLMFLFMSIPRSPLLGNYRRARYTMAGAYLFFIAVAVMEYLSGAPSVQNVPLMQTTTLTIAASQAFLFTFAMLALVEVRFPGWRYIFGEAAVILLFIVIVFTVYACCSEAFYDVAFYVFAIIYSLLLVRYTCLFLKSYRQFRYRMDNYYSDEEAGRLRWVIFSFFASLAVGVTALLSAVFMSTLIALLFSIIFDVFYIFFAIRFVNYAHQFQVIECAMDDDAPEDEDAALPESKKTAISLFAQNIIETNLKVWADGKRFLQSGLTIDDVSRHIGTNSKYLSLYINQTMNRTFREWINGLRIEEAKRLLLKHPDMTVAEVAERTGFSDRSYFTRQFTTQMNTSPREWQKQIKN
jgi:AraC-like DNA-binding protein